VTRNQKTRLSFSESVSLFSQTRLAATPVTAVREPDLHFPIYLTPFVNMLNVFNIIVSDV
jgi:hypothetical protein